MDDVHKLKDTRVHGHDENRTGKDVHIQSLKDNYKGA